jgi:hypothetical protein
MGLRFQFWGRRFGCLRDERGALVQRQRCQQEHDTSCGDVIYGLHLSREPFRLHHMAILNPFI